MKEVYIFEYERDWMILLYKDGKEDKYWNSAEDSWDKTLDIIDLLELPEENIYKYQMEDYNQVCEVVEDVFNITKENIADLNQFRITIN